MKKPRELRLKRKKPRRLLMIKKPKGLRLKGKKPRRLLMMKRKLRGSKLSELLVKKKQRDWLTKKKQKD